MRHIGINMIATGKRLKELCDERGVTAMDLKVLLNFTSRTPVYKVFSGKNLFDIQNMMLVAEYLGVKVEDIIVMDESHDE